VQSPQWSPNSQQILFTSLTQETETPETDVKIIRRIAYRFNEKGYFEGKRNHLFTITPSNPNPIQITHGAYDVESPDWVDNNQIAFLSNLTADADVTRDKYIYRVSSINGEPIQITQLKQAISALKVAPNGDEIAYLGQLFKIFGLSQKMERVPQISRKLSITTLETR
jgi:dipeptidyl aminopeptidase/acylaminoacyl peptidase